jgi:cytochrome c-type biogenesis protein
MTGASIAAAFTAGALSFVTPCCLPLVPGYLAAIGIGDAASSRGAPPRQVLRASLPFVLGFGAVFVLLGAGAGALSDALRDYRPELTHPGGIVVVAMGFAMLGLLPLPGLQTNLQPALEPARRTGSAALLGVAFAVAWSPCSTPVLASILVLASQTGHTVQASALLGVYALGLAIPFLVVALAFAHTIGALRWMRDRYDAIRLVSGTVLVAFGLMVFFDRVWWMSTYVDHVLRAVGLDALPAA